MNEQLNIVSQDPIELDDDKKSVTKVAKTEEAVDAVKPKIESKVEAEPAAAEKEPETKETIETEEPPTAPPRPVSPGTTMRNTLKEAFPSVSDRVITGVLIASQGNLDSSFNALLYISDETIEAPPIVPVPVAAAPVREETDDEKLARQLQKEFELEERRRRRRAKQKHHQEEGDESPDEFEQIKKNFSEGLEEARTTLNGWVSGLAKKFDGEPKNDKLFGALGGSSFKKQNSNQFDEDPKILQNFEKIQLDDKDKAPELPKRKPAAPSMTVNSDAFLVDDSEDEDKIL